MLVIPLYTFSTSWSMIVNLVQRHLHVCSLVEPVSRLYPDITIQHSVCLAPFFERSYLLFYVDFALTSLWGADSSIAYIL